MRNMSFKLFMSIGFLFLVAVLAISPSMNGAVAQDGGRSAAPGKSTGGTSFGSTPLALDSLLYDQTAGETTSGSMSSTLLEDDADIELADDFEVTDEAWDVTGVVANGFWFFDDPTTIEQMKVNFFENAGTLPGALACAADVDTYSDSGGVLTVEFATPCTLEQGIYWMSILPGYDSDQGFGSLWYVWYWLGHDQVASESAHRDVDDWWGDGCTTWVPMTSCYYTSTGLSFQIYGEVTEIEDEEPDDPDPAPVPAEPAIHVPNIGTVMVTTGAPTRVYEAPGGGVLRNGGQEVWFPRDADGNGYDTYTVTRTVTLDNGEVWLGVFMGTDTWVYLPYDAVIPLTWLDVE